jgi:hydrogenase maturation protease
VTSLDRVVGLGSPHGSDAVGWLVIERLRRQAGLRADLVTATPDRLTDLARDCRRLVVVDACRGELATGEILRLEWPDPRIDQWPALSTHGFGAGEALRLAEALGWLPPRIVLLVVGIGPAGGSAAESGFDLSHAVAELAGRVRQELRGGGPGQTPR